MHKVTLVCSQHRENGLCNAEELLKILRAIEPEIVFEEIRPSDFDSYCKHGRSLEAQAITRYREFKSFRRVPVDRYDIPENRIAELKREFDGVFDYVEHTSREYGLLKEEIATSVHQKGLGFLNSADFAALMARIAGIEDKIIIDTGDEGLIRGLEKWRHLIQRRDREMIATIHEYCRVNTFGTGVLLVGAAHKTGIVREIEKYAVAEANLIEWKQFL